MWRAIVTLAIGLQLAVVCCGLVSTENEESLWFPLELKPFYDEAFNVSDPFINLSLWTGRGVDNTASSTRDFVTVSCVYDLITVDWSISESIRDVNVLPHAVIVLAPASDFSSALATPLGTFQDYLTKQLRHPIGVEIHSSDDKQRTTASVNSLGEVVAEGEQLLLPPMDFEAVDWSAKNMIVECHTDLNSKRDAFCIPATQQVQLLQDMQQLVIRFDVPTNTPPLRTLNELIAAFEIVPNLQEEPLDVVWVNRQHLVITLNVSDSQRIVDAVQRAESVRIQRRDASRSYFIGLRGQQSLRVFESGEMQIFIVDRRSGEVLSPRRILVVEDSASLAGRCKVVLLPPMLWTSLDNHALTTSATLKSESWPSKAFSLSGLFAISGKQSITVSPTAAPIMDIGSWSLSMWIRILESPTGNYRCVFHKSHESNRSLRTPSVWLLPDSNRLTLRVSTNESIDAGVISNYEIPMNKWTMLTFVFKNKTVSTDVMQGFDRDIERTDGVPRSMVSSPLRSESQDKELNKFAASIYVDGKLDFRASFVNEVLPNIGELRLFKDSSFQGPRGFAQQIHLFNGALSSSQIQRLYAQGLQNAQTTALNRALNTALDVLVSAQSRLLPFIEQWEATPREPQVALDQLKENYMIEAYSYQAQSVTKRSSEPLVTDKWRTELLEDNHRRQSDGLSKQQIMGKSYVDSVSQQSFESITKCEPVDVRMQLHKESAALGNAESLVHVAQLSLFGFEAPLSQCGYSVLSQTVQREAQGLSTARPLSNRVRADESHENVLSIDELPPLARDSAVAVLGLVVAAHHGHAKALVPLVFSMIQGVGLEGLLLHNRTLGDDWLLALESDPLGADMFSGSASSRSPINNKLRVMLGKVLIDALSTCQEGSTRRSSVSVADDELNELSQSLLCNSYFESAGLGKQTTKSSSNENTDDSDISTVNDLVLGLLFVAAMHGEAEAHVMLAHRFELGIGGVQKDLELAAQYSLLPMQVSSDNYHTHGAQPIVESDRIDDNTVHDIGKGQQGDNDELIQHQIVRAREGDVPSMLAMGDLYYYGARGLPRDQEQALRYFTQAANAGDTQGMCGAASMYLKGEGTATNVTKAIALYEQATHNGSVRAFNGLGYLYFYGNQVPKNESKAFEYFLLAAGFENDGDALFNVGFCLENGIGVTADLSRAVHYYSLGAQKTGHFDCIRTMATLSIEGRGVPRSAVNALTYFNAAKSIGPWMGWLRRGLDLFLAAAQASPSLFASPGHFSSLSIFSTGGSSSSLSSASSSVFLRSAMCYLYAGELGSEVAQSNAAYILRTVLYPDISKYSSENVFAHPTSFTLHMLNRALMREYMLSGVVHNRVDRLVHLGHCHFHGHCGLARVDYQKAKAFYHLALHHKHELSAAYLAVMHHFQLGYNEKQKQALAARDRMMAERYYERVRASAALSDSLQLRTMLTVLQQMLRWSSSSAISSFWNPVQYSAEYVVKALWAL